MAFFEDIVDKVTRKLGQAFLRNPGDTANMGDVANPIRTDPTGTTPQPISGTVAATQSGAWAVTANAGTNLNTSLLALDSTLTNKTQFSKITDGTNTMSVSAASAAKVDGSAVIQPVSGTVTVTQATAANLKVDLSGTAANATAIKVDGSAATQPVSGTVTANIGTTNGLALDATLTGGTQKTKLVDTGGVNVATVSVAGAVKVDGSAVTQPVSGTFFQATQPVSAAALPLPAGASTAAKQPALGTAGTASADVITVQGIASMTALKVDGSAVTQPVSNAGLTNLDVALSTRLKPADTLTAVTTVSTVTAVTAITNALPTGANSIGQVTANAGTNLNTSALALDATLTGRTQKSQVTDGTRDGTVKAASTLPLLTDTALVTTQRDPIPAGTNVIGHTIIDTGSTTAVTQATASNLNAQVSGDVANAAADSGNPVKTGGRAATTNPTAVTDAQRVNSMRDKLGKAIVIVGAPRELTTQANVTLTTTTETTLIAAGGAGVFNDLTCLFISNTSLVTRRVDFRDATAGTVRFSINVSASSTHPVPMTCPITQTTANNNWTIQLDGASTDVRIFAQAIKTT